VLVLGKPFQPSLMFAGKARGLPQSGAPERGFIWAGTRPWTYPQTLEQAAQNKLECLVLASLFSVIKPLMAVMDVLNKLECWSVMVHCSLS
jgi:hypothetical protein